MKRQILQVAGILLIIIGMLGSAEIVSSLMLKRKARLSTYAYVNATQPPATYRARFTLPVNMWPVAVSATLLGTIMLVIARRVDGDSLYG